MFQNRNTFATLPRTQRGMPLVLGGDPKGKNFLYPNGNSIVIRDIENPAIADIYTEHSTMTTVAKYSPSGFYICSADQGGKIRIWDTTQKEHILKNEFQPFAGNIKDLSWSADSQRIVVVGEGRERFGHVIMMETGTSVGEIAGHSKTINSCDFRPARPFRIITGSEDNFVGIYEGPPFKFKTQLEDHSRFVQSVRYSPDGQLFATAGFDGKMFIYNANDYSKIGEFTVGEQKKPAHSGGIYAISWSSDGKQILSASGDKTCKVWDVGTLASVTEFPMGSDVLDQQVSCLWQNNYLLSVSLSGFINYLDVNNPSQPIRVVKGHNKTITALTIKSINEEKTLYTGSCDGYVTHWNPQNGDHDRIVGKPHSNQVSSLVFDGNNRIYSVGFDDMLRVIDANTNEFVQEFKLDQQPQSAALSKDKQILLLACHSQLQVRRVNDGGIISTLAAPYEPSSISVNPENGDVAVGGGRDKKVHLYTFDGQKLTEKSQSLDHREGITDVSFSPDGKLLAASDQNRKIVLYNTETYQPAHDLEWGYHTARVNCLAWSPDSKFLASGSLDTCIIVWDCANPTKHYNLKSMEP
ncbi:actin-interacting protein 1-like protein [Sarcoptes scabiei]|uniref:Actin-interacting protein 1 n=1 Tax=Sarcoptes scabiei TaxID=52283 RepID=A0A132A9Q6_SARSC|nr:actin-interacting protein 1-like protein [Sarcoptes scabiei]